MATSSYPSILTQVVPEDRELSASDVNALNALWRQLSEHVVARSGETLRLDAKRATILFARRGDDNEIIIGTATLNIYPTATGKVGVIDDVVVDKEYRRQGIGEILLRKLIVRGKMAGLRKISLTSAEYRGAARSLYEKLGFVRIDKYYEMQF